MFPQVRVIKLYRHALRLCSTENLSDEVSATPLLESIIGSFLLRAHVSHYENDELFALHASFHWKFIYDVILFIQPDTFWRELGVIWCCYFAFSSKSCCHDRPFSYHLITSWFSNHLSYYNTAMEHELQMPHCDWRPGFWSERPLFGNVESLWLQINYQGAIGNETS